LGVRLLIAGTGLLIAKLKAFEAPPPGDGLKTLMLAAPAVVMSVAGIRAVNCVLLTKFDGRAFPFHLTTEPLTKFEPLTVSMKSEPPTTTAPGLRLVIVGTGLGGLTIKVREFDTPPPGAGLKTVTLTGPAMVRS